MIRISVLIAVPCLPIAFIGEITMLLGQRLTSAQTGKDALPRIKKEESRRITEGKA